MKARKKKSQENLIGEKMEETLVKDTPSKIAEYAIDARRVILHAVPAVDLLMFISKLKFSGEVMKNCRFVWHELYLILGY